MASATSAIVPSCAVTLVGPKQLAAIGLDEAKLAEFAAAGANMDIGQSQPAIDFMRKHHIARCKALTRSHRHNQGRWPKKDEHERDTLNDHLEQFLEADPPMVCPCVGSDKNREAADLARRMRDNPTSVSYKAFMRTHHSTVPGAHEGTQTQPGAVVETRRTGTK